MYNYLKSDTQIVFWGYDRQVSYEIYKDQIIIPLSKSNLAEEFEEMNSKINNIKKYTNIESGTLNLFENMKFESTP